MIGDAGAAPPALEAGVDDRLERLAAVAPDRVHLEVAAVLLARRRALPRQDLADRRPAEELAAEAAQPRDFLLLARVAHRLLDERGGAVVDHLARDAVGRRADAGNRLERVGRHQRRDVAIDAQHRLRGALVAPRALAVAGDRRHVVQRTRQLEVDVTHRCLNYCPSCASRPSWLIYDLSVRISSNGAD